MYYDNLIQKLFLELRVKLERERRAWVCQNDLLIDQRQRQQWLYRGFQMQRCWAHNQLDCGMQSLEGDERKERLLWKALGLLARTLMAMLLLRLEGKKSEDESFDKRSFQG